MPAPPALWLTEEGEGQGGLQSKEAPTKKPMVTPSLCPRAQLLGLALGLPPDTRRS